MSSIATPDLSLSSPISYTSSAIFYLLASVLMLWVVYYRLTRKRLYQLAAQIPGPKGFPLIGHAHLFVGNSNSIFENVYKRTFDFKPSSPLKFWVGNRLIVFLFDPRDIEVILGSHVHINKSPEYRLFEPWLGNGLLISTGEKWRAHRKLIAPTFHLNVLKTFIDLFNKNSLDTVRKMGMEGSKEFDVHDYMSECTVDILLETVMGVNKQVQQAGFDYAKAVMKMCDILHLRQTKAWLKPDLLFKITKSAKDQVKLLDFIHRLTNDVIKKKKEEVLLRRKNTTTGTNTSIEMDETYNENKEGQDMVVKTEPMTTYVSVEGSSYGQSAGLKDDLDVDDNDDDVGEKKRQAFLDMLIESAANGEVLTDNEVREQVDTIMFEGHDTTAAGSSFFLCIMGTRPDIQDKVVEELQGIFGDSDRPVTFQDTLQMKYMERCIMETLRMYPPVPIIARELQEEVKLKSSDLILPTKCTVIIGTVKLHRNPDIFPNPDEFNPDNFLPENTSNRHYYAFVPFSAGPRSCVGRKYAMLKLKIMLATILRNYKVYSDSRQKDWKLQADIILKRTDGFNIRLEPRKIKPISLISDR